ncbi:MAG: helix-turn-helix transcriptional regulator [Rhizobiaceae bacterium]
MDPSGIPDTDDAGALWQWLADKLLRECDIKGVFYLAYPVGDSGGTPETLILRAIWNTSYPEIYLSALPGNPLTNDYSANHVLQTGNVSRWHDPESPAKMTQGERDRIKLDEKYNMTVGCCFPIFTRSRRICGGFGLRSNSQDADKFDTMLHQNQEALGRLLIAFDERYRGPYAKTIFKLSPQEVRVLAYLAGGMSVAKLAHEMGLSVKTIEAYMSSARKKTSSSTSAEAVAKSIFFNLV